MPGAGGDLRGVVRPELRGPVERLLQLRRLRGPLPLGVRRADLVPGLGLLLGGGALTMASGESLARARVMPSIVATSGQAATLRALTAWAGPDDVHEFCRAVAMGRTPMAVRYWLALVWSRSSPRAAWEHLRCLVYLQRFGGLP